jgi:hypothetical protein
VSDTSVHRCIGGAVVNKKRVCRVIAFVVFGALGSAGAAADEMTVAPAAFITAPTGQFNWAGLYFGVNGGYAGSSSSVAYGADDAGVFGRHLRRRRPRPMHSQREFPDHRSARRRAARL